MFICVKLSVLCNAPLCAFLQANKPQQVTESSKPSILAVFYYFFLFYIFTILLVPYCSIVFVIFFTYRVYTACTTFIYSYIHTSCDAFMKENKTITLVTDWTSDWLIISPPLLLGWILQTQSAHSWGGTKLFSQQWRRRENKNKTSGETKYMNIISVPHRQTHNAVYLLCVLSCWENIPVLTLAVSGDAHKIR